MENFYIIEEPALVAQISEKLGERDAHINKYTLLAKEHGFIGANIQGNRNLGLGAFRCSGFYIANTDCQKVDRNLWKTAGTTRFEGENGHIHDASIYLPRKTNKRFYSELIQKLPLQFNESFTLEAVIDKLCDRNWIFGGVTRLSLIPDAVLVKVSGETSVISPHMKEIKESEFLQKLGK
ncbi:hypothetical protein [Acinetobacter seifertii]|uniref:hypothetical protein n=1 Tax=Acinetobacter seifertii TaxID=1530123 RepID=UPI0019041CD3|nr:hypothetical protein [Acinetobacter seifertii]MBJ9425186.1 hypothetical protein [Acinetobacter seifertii]